MEGQQGPEQFKNRKLVDITDGLSDIFPNGERLEQWLLDKIQDPEKSQSRFPILIFRDGKTFIVLDTNLPSALTEANRSMADIEFATAMGGVTTPSEESKTHTPYLNIQLEDGNVAQVIIEKEPNIPGTTGITTRDQYDKLGKIFNIDGVTLVTGL